MSIFLKYTNAVNSKKMQRELSTTGDILVDNSKRMQRELSTKKGDILIVPPSVQGYICRPSHELSELDILCLPTSHNNGHQTDEPSFH